MVLLWCYAINAGWDANERLLFYILGSSDLDLTTLRADKINLAAKESPASCS